MALETIAMATVSPSLAAWKTVRHEASWGWPRKSRVSTESQPRCTAALASASIARAENTVSRQPRFPQEQTEPCGSTVRWPTFPAMPECPRKMRPLTKAAPPTPLPRVSMRAFCRPRAAPHTISPASATRASLSANTGTSSGRPTRSTMRNPSRKCSGPRRLSMRVVAGSIMPLQPTPTPAGCSVLSTSQPMASCKDGRNESRSAGVGMVRPLALQTFVREGLLAEGDPFATSPEFFTLLDFVKERCRTLDDLARLARPYFTSLPFSIDAALVDAHLRKDPATTRALLTDATAALE